MKNIKKISWAVVFAISTNNLFASGIIVDESELEATLDPSNPGGDPGATSINMFVIPMIVIGIFIAYYLIKNNYFAIKTTKINEE
jgi:hypothetical protein